MSAQLAEPDYQLVWPRGLLRAEAAKLLNHRDLRDRDDRCELMLEDAFVRGYEGGPLTEFREVTEHFAANDPWPPSPQPKPTMTAKQQFLRDLMGKADLVGARNSAGLRDLRVFVDHAAEPVTSDDRDIASFGLVQWS